MGDYRKLDASQRQELTWLLDEADLAVQSWWQAEEVRWPEILTRVVARLRLCGFDLEAEGIASDVQATPKIGMKGCRNHHELMELRRLVVDRVRKRIVAIRKVMAPESQPPMAKPLHAARQSEREGRRTKPTPAKSKRSATVNEQMAGAIMGNPEAMGWNSTQWSKHLKCAKSSVVETATWEKLESARLQAKAERMKDRRRKPKASDSRRD